MRPVCPLCPLCSQLSVDEITKKTTKLDVAADNSTVVLYSIASTCNVMNSIVIVYHITSIIY